MDAFQVFVTFSAIDHLTGPMARMAREMGLLNERSAALQARMDRFRNMAFVGGAMTVGGLAIAKGMDVAIESAGRLQSSIMGVQEALKLTGPEFQKAMMLAQTAGIPTVFSSEEVGTIMKAMATAGLTKDQVLNPKVLQQYVDFADVQHLNKHENAADVAGQAVNMAHLFGLYSTKEVSPFLNRLNAALVHTHDSAAEFATQFRFIAKQASAMGMNSGDTLAATAWLGRMGFGGGRGGTNFATFLTRSIYGSSGKKADAAMVEAGFVKNGRSVFTTGQGKFVGVPEAVKILQDFGKRFNNNANQMSPLLHHIFGTQGARIAMMMSSHGASEQWKMITKQMGETDPIHVMQERRNKTWEGQMKQFKSMLADIGQNIGIALMPNLLAMLKVMNRLAEKALHFTQTHPGFMKMAAVALQVAAGVLLTVGPLLTIVGALGWLASSGVIGAGIGMIGSALATGLPIIGMVIAALALLHTAWTGNWFHMREFVHDSFTSMIKWMNEYVTASDTSSAKTAATWAKHHKIMMQVSSQFEIDQKAMWEAIKETGNTCAENIKYSFSETFAFIDQKLRDFDDWMTEHGFFGAAEKTQAQKDADETATGLWRGNYKNLRGKKHIILPGDINDLNNFNKGLPSPGQPVPVPGPDPTSMNIQPGAIVINAQAHHNPKQIADEVMRQIAFVARNRSYGSPDAPQSVW